MTDRLRLNKALDSSFAGLSSRTLKTPLASKRFEFPEMMDQQFSPSKMMQKYKHQANKSETYLLHEEKAKK